MIRFAPERPVAAACPSNRLPSLRNWWCHAWKGAWMEHGRMEGRNCISSGFMRPPACQPVRRLAGSWLYLPSLHFRALPSPSCFLCSFLPSVRTLSLLLGLRSFVVPITAPAAALPPRHAPRTLNYGMAKPRSTHPPCVRARAGRILNGLFQRLTPRDEDEEVPKWGRKSGRRMGS